MAKLATRMTSMEDKISVLETHVANLEEKQKMILDIISTQRQTIDVLTTHYKQSLAPPPPAVIKVIDNPKIDMMKKIDLNSRRVT